MTVNSVDNTTVGTYAVIYDITDASGNAATQVIRMVYVDDTTPPVIKSVTLNTTNTFIGNDIFVTVEAIDNTGITAVEAEGIALSPVGDNWTGTITALKRTNIVHVSSSDAAGNVVWDNSTSYTAGPPTATLTFIVTDSKTNKPLAGAIVSIKNIKVITDKNGVAEITNLEFGSHKWAIRMNKYKRISEVVTVNGDMTIAKELVRMQR